MIEAWMTRPLDSSDVFVVVTLAIMFGIGIGAVLRNQAIKRNK